MKVVCNRCSTEYEFDDALVSKRGTTVKCTNCGHQFRVRPDPALGQLVDDRWILRKPDGRTLTFTTMRELQKAIETGLVVGEDAFSRDGRNFRPLSAVAELETFLRKRTPVAPGPEHQTLTGIQPAAGSKAQPSVPGDPMPLSSSIPPPPPEMTARTNSDAPTRRVDGLEEISDRVTPNMMAPAAHKTDRSLTRRRGRRLVGNTGADEVPQRTNGAVAEDNLPTQRAEDLSASDALTGQSATDTPVRFVRSARTGSVREQDELEAVAEAMDRHSRHLSAASTSQMSPLSMPPPSPRPSGLRWIFGLVVVGALALLAGTVGKDYLSRFVSPEGATGETDQRVEAMLRLGDELYRMGDLEGAKAEFDKASVLEPKNASVLAGLARLEATRADVYWLEKRIVTDATKKAEAQVALERRLAKLKVAVDALRAIDSADPEVRGVIVDSLRLQGEITAARKSVAELGTQSSNPRIAYVLAALDLAEASPDYETVKARLRTAVGGERGLGRARAALIYALAKSGDKEGAEEELAKLKQGNHPYPLIADLTKFVAEVPDEPEDSAETTKAASGKKTKGKAGSKDTRSALERAVEARKAGQWDAAASFYQQALQQNPGNIEAICGLGDASKARGNTAAAESHYDAALRINPEYRPALVGSAGLKWAAGNRSEAVRLYKRLLASGSSSKTAKDRIAEFEGKASANNEGASPKETSAPAEDSAQPAPEAKDPPKSGEGETPAPKAEEPVTPKAEEKPEPPAAPEKSKAEGDLPLE